MTLPPPPFLTLARDLHLTALAPGDGAHLTGLPHAGDEVLFAARDARGRRLGLGGVVAIDWSRRSGHLAWIAKPADAAGNGAAAAAAAAVAGPAMAGLARYALDELGLEVLEADQTAPGAGALAALGFERAGRRWHFERRLFP